MGGRYPLVERREKKQERSGSRVGADYFNKRAYAIRHLDKIKAADAEKVFKLGRQDTARTINLFRGRGKGRVACHATKMTTKRSGEERSWVEEIGARKQEPFVRRGNEIRAKEGGCGCQS